MEYFTPASTIGRLLAPRASDVLTLASGPSPVQLDGRLRRGLRVDVGDSSLDVHDEDASDGCTVVAAATPCAGLLWGDSLHNGPANSAAVGL